MGLRVARTKVGVYAISGFCSALAGLLVLRLHAPPATALHAVGMELDAIAAVVIGGTLLTGGRGFVVGSVIGVLVLGTIQTFISFDGTRPRGGPRSRSVSSCSPSSAFSEPWHCDDGKNRGGPGDYRGCPARRGPIAEPRATARCAP